MNPAADRWSLLAPKRTNGANLAMSVDRGRPEVAGGASNRLE
jgi:hypothetical protein